MFFLSSSFFIIKDTVNHIRGSIVCSNLCSKKYILKKEAFKLDISTISIVSFSFSILHLVFSYSLFPISLTYAEVYSQKVFSKTTVLQNFPKFAEEHLRRSLFFNKVASLGWYTGKWNPAP